MKKTEHEIARQIGTIDRDGNPTGLKIFDQHYSVCFEGTAGWGQLRFTDLKEATNLYRAKRKETTTKAAWMSFWIMTIDQKGDKSNNHIWKRVYRAKGFREWHKNRRWVD